MQRSADYLCFCCSVCNGIEGAGVLDFTGGPVIHLSAGTGGLVAAKVLGRRHGYGNENLSPKRQ